MENPPPVPFGDPTKVQTENSTAVKKGLLFGCSGCVLVIVAVVLFVGAIIAVIMASIRNSDPCQLTLAAAKNSAELKAALGEPMELGWIVSGSVKYNGGDGQADMNIPIEGPNGSASVHTIGTKSSGGDWQWTKMEAIVTDKGTVVNLKPQ